MAGAAFGLAPQGHIKVDIWSDVMCPFCYMGDALLEQALAAFEHRDAVDIEYHSFLLQPDLPVDTALKMDDFLATTKGFPREQAAAMNAQVAARGKQVGLDYRFDLAIATNTRRAHELSHFAKREGRQHEMIQRLFRAYFTEGANVGDRGILADLAAEIGLDREAAAASLATGEFAAAVEADIQAAGRLGIQGVPFFVFDGKYAVSGAQPVEAFTQVLTRVWNESADAPAAAAR
ncbi:MAG: DsbA family oxidoreductase [Actinomyces sp.]|jgi:predicted DsbA family dithiol-disulfide isomerase|nr:DsbA family oxidoreductase [Actinomyces sp.]MCI1788526.1 DsbA family oxidoreductase [Actinomyces sp.]